MELVINILKVILLGLVIAFVGFQLGKFINDIQVKKFHEESEDKIILPEKDICDSCKYLKFKNTDEAMKQDDVYRYKCLKFDEYYDSCPERCIYYSPSNRLKQSDITQVNTSNYPEINIEDDTFDIRPLLESATTVRNVEPKYNNKVEVSYWRPTSSRYIFECSGCAYHHYKKSLFCPNCCCYMSNNEENDINDSINRRIY